MKVSGAKIRELRLQRLLDQHSLAERLRGRGLGTTQATISRWERGRGPRAHALPALAAELGVTVEELYADSDDEEDEADLLIDLRSALERYIDRRVQTVIEDAR